MENKKRNIEAMNMESKKDENIESPITPAASSAESGTADTIMSTPPEDEQSSNATEPDSGTSKETENPVLEKPASENQDSEEKKPEETDLENPVSECPNPDSADSDKTSDDNDTRSSKKSADGFRNFKAIAEAFARGRGIKKEEYSKVIDTISSIRRGFENGDIPLDCFELIQKGINYDRDVSAAAAEGELKGRNDVISETVFPERPDDGLPHFNAGHTSMKKSRSNSIFDLARNAQ